jgi:hypothetical protein
MNHSAVPSRSAASFTVSSSFMVTSLLRGLMDRDWPGRQFLAGLVYGHGLGVAGRRPAPADLLHQQMSRQDEGDRGHGEHRPGDRPGRAHARR